MNNMKRIFGSGPKGLLVSVMLFWAAYYLKSLLPIPEIFTDQKYFRITVFALLTATTIIIFIWSLISLNPKMRGKTLITSGALQYFRHPLYAAFVSFFNFGLAVLLNNWVFIIWALLLHPVWHVLVRDEEEALRRIFPHEYEEYCKRTGRFFPRIIKQKG